MKTRAVAILVIFATLLLAGFALWSGDSDSGAGATAANPSSEKPADLGAGAGASASLTVPVPPPPVPAGTIPAMASAAAKRADAPSGSGPAAAPAESGSGGERAPLAAPEGSPRPPPHVDPFPSTREGIQAAVRAALPQLRECYDEWLKANSGLGGRITLSFAVVDDEVQPEEGKVTDLTVKQGGLGNPLLEGCVKSVFTSLRFEAPLEERIEVNYPLQFDRSDR